MDHTEEKNGYKMVAKLLRLSILSSIRILTIIRISIINDYQNINEIVDYQIINYLSIIRTSITSPIIRISLIYLNAKVSQP